MREACETIVCPGEECNWNRKCMEKCFREKADAIKSCCTEECPDGYGREECLSACNTILVYPEYDDDEYPIQLSVRTDGGYTVIMVVLGLVLILYLVFLIRRGKM